jgi:hypothetical protein
LKSIVLLHQTQVELVGAQKRLAGIPEWMRELHEEHSRRQAEIDAVALRRDEAERARRAAEAALADAQEKAKKYQSQISQVSTQREYTALLKEIDTVKAQVAEHEKDVLEAIEQYDQAGKDLGELRDAFRELDERYQAELAKWESEKPAVARRVEELGREVEELRSRLPRSTLSFFDRVSDRYGTQALSRVVKIQARGAANAMWHCEACSFNVRPQVVVEIRNGGAVTACDSCKRILFLADDDA